MPDKPNQTAAASPKKAPAIFDAKRRAQLQRRAARRRARQSEPQFIHARIAQDMADRLLMINRQFKKALLIAPDGFAPLLKDALHKDKTPTKMMSTPLARLGPTIKSQTGFDLVILCGVHHAENDPAGLISALKQRMVDDGHIMTVCLGGDSLSSLRRALYGADQTYFGGISPRMHPMMEMQPNVGLLAHCGFKLTVGDRDKLNVTYQALTTLIGDLRDMGEGYALQIKPAAKPIRAYWQHAEQTLKAGQPKFNVVYDILWAGGWTAHESQQKPLKPGSAKFHLSEAFKPKTP